MLPSEGYSPASNFHWPSFIQFILSLVAMVTLWGLALVLVVLGLGQVSQALQYGQELTQLYLVAAGIFLAGTLLLPSTIFAAAGMVNRTIETPEWLSRISHPALLIFLLPFVILLGDQIAKRPGVAWFGLPPLHVLAVGIPVLLLLSIGLRGLRTGSSQRAWGIFSAGLVIAPVLVLFIELLAVVAVVMLVTAYLSNQPFLMEQLAALVEQMQRSGEIPEEMLQELVPYLARPELVFLLFAFVTGLVPLVEEALKPVGVFLFSTQIVTPEQGFTAGLLSGAGFALFENLLLSTFGGEWALSVLTRIGAGLLHIMATGLVGWGLALAWRERRYGRLVAAYLTAVLIHGAWNAMALLSGAAALGLDGRANLEELSQAAAVGLAVLAGLMLILLFASNRSFRRARLDRSASH